MKQLIFFSVFSYLILVDLNGRADQHIQQNIGNDKDTVEVLRKIISRKAIKKPIGDLLDKIGMKYSYIHFVEMKPYYLAFVSFQYADNLWLDIYVEKYSHIRQVLDENDYINREKFWNIEELRREKIAKIRLRNKDNTLEEYPKKPRLPNW